MTTYILSLRTLGGDEAEPDPALTTLADLRATDPVVIGATLRALADRLDPPKPVRPAHRGVGRDAEGFPLVYDPDADKPRCPAVQAPGGQRCARTAHGDIGHKLVWSSGGPLRWDGPGGIPVPLRDSNGLPNYAHDADCNTIHDAGPEPCPPPRIATRAQIDAMVCPDCTDDAHTYEAGKCALKPPWNGVVVDGKAPGTTPYSG